MRVVAGVSVKMIASFEERRSWGEQHHLPHYHAVLQQWLRLSKPELYHQPIFLLILKGVYLPYCNGASWASNRAQPVTRVVGAGTEQEREEFMYYRGFPTNVRLTLKSTPGGGSGGWSCSHALVVRCFAGTSLRYTNSHSIHNNTFST